MNASLVFLIMLSFIVVLVTSFINLFDCFKLAVKKTRLTKLHVADRVDKVAYELGKSKNVSHNSCSESGSCQCKLAEGGVSVQLA